MLKPQDIIFLVTLFSLILKYRNNPRVFIVLGIICLIISIPLFSFWIFFTAERLTWYAAAFFLVAIIVNLLKFRKNKWVLQSEGH